MRPDDPLATHFRLARPQQLALGKLGITTVRDLLYHFPSRYDRGGSESAIKGLSRGGSATLFGTIHKLDTRRSWKRRIPVGEGELRDSSGAIKIMWFHQPYLAKKFSEGQFVKAVGVVSGSGEKLYLANPHVERADPADVGLLSPRAEAPGALFAIYPESRGVSSLWFRHALARAFEKGALDHLEDPISADVLARYHLPSLAEALVRIHTPEKLAHAEAARKRFAFEEIFTLRVAQARERAENDAMPSAAIRDGARLANEFLARIPFPPTGAQRRAIEEICNDLGEPRPMARLLEGDVGSGKTLVAAATAYAVVNSRPSGRESGTLQVAYMAPTEILAKQHFRSFIEYYRHLPISIALLTGSGCQKFPSKVSPDEPTDISRAQLLKWVESGEIAMLVGTHALIQKSVRFKHLEYAIVDEQHRFGTRQRAALAQKNSIKDGGRAAAGIAEHRPRTPRVFSDVRKDEVERSGGSGFAMPAAAQAAPHFLSMTATPIPRTLALTLYGDLDLSVLDELPQDRARITTAIVTPSKRDEAYEKIRAQVREGRQAYVICPRIEEPDPAKIGALIAKSAKAEVARLKKDVFSEFEMGLLHGAMRPAEKDAVMRRFADGDIDILVATSVVEVGVNVPNATVILIEGAERFGLSQLHQLRGRVQRSSHPPYCFLLAESRGEAALKRLRILEKSADGFALAEADLETRGTGDLYGVKQWGVSDIGMEALKNPKLINAAREEARRIVTADPALETYPALKARAAFAARALHAE